jgi:hypothetical protein
MKQTFIERFTREAYWEFDGFFITKKDFTEAERAVLADADTYFRRWPSEIVSMDLRRWDSWNGKPPHVQLTVIYRV